MLLIFAAAVLLLLIFAAATAAAAAAAAAAAVLLLCCWPLLLFAASTSMPRPHALTLTPHSSGCDRARVVLVLVVCSRCAFVHSVLVFVSVFCASHFSISSRMVGSSYRHKDCLLTRRRSILPWPRPHGERGGSFALLQLGVVTERIPLRTDQGVVPQ